MQKFIGKVLLRDDFCNDTCAKYMKFSKMLSVQAKGHVKTPNNPLLSFMACYACGWPMLTYFMTSLRKI